MQRINRLLINLLSSSLEESKHFYTTLFDFKAEFDSDWFVNLISESRSLELGLIHPSSDIVPDGLPSAAQGFYLTFVVEDVEATYQLAQSKGYDITAAPHDTFYGQRRMLLRAPDGVVVDVSSPM